MNRRGNHPVTIILWIVSLLVVALALLAIFFSLKGWFLTGTEDSVCASQIISHSSLAGITNNQVAPQIDCPTKAVVVSTTDQREAKEAIAKEMASCWSQWGRGELSLFGRDEGVYCHICSMITVDGLQQVEGLPAYLDTTAYKRDVTYAQYLSGTKGGDVFDEKAYPAYGDWRMETKEPIAVIFYHAKGATGMDRVYSYLVGDPMKATLLGAQGGALAGNVAGGVAVAGAIVVGTTIGVISAPITIGVAVTAAGVVATTTVAGAALGSGLGLSAAMQKPELSTMSVVIVRPLNSANIQALGCQYAPVG